MNNLIDGTNLMKRIGWGALIIVVFLCLNFLQSAFGQIVTEARATIHLRTDAQRAAVANLLQAQQDGRLTSQYINSFDWIDPSTIRPEALETQLQRLANVRNSRIVFHQTPFGPNIMVVEEPSWLQEPQFIPRPRRVDRPIIIYNIYINN